MKLGATAEAIADILCEMSGNPLMQDYLTAALVKSLIITAHKARTDQENRWPFFIMKIFILLPLRSVIGTVLIRAMGGLVAQEKPLFRVLREELLILMTILIFQSEFE